MVDPIIFSYHILPSTHDQRIESHVRNPHANHVPRYCASLFLRQRRFQRYPLIFQEHGVNVTWKSNFPILVGVSSFRANTRGMRGCYIFTTVSLKWLYYGKMEELPMNLEVYIVSRNIVSRYVLITIIAQLTSLLPHTHSITNFQALMEFA